MDFITAINAEAFLTFGIGFTSVVSALIIKKIAESLAIKIVAWRDFKNNLNISIGTRLRLSTSTGFIDGNIIQADYKRITVLCDEVKVFIPTKDFSSTTWTVVKRNLRS